ncbi:transcription factor RFX4-like [Tachypleus tridentatus]|uniref:transcription factor RFX4-like n=1 Tax=Tachypleus tridentatus TaxID=6853 RepID=UPI003FD51631
MAPGAETPYGKHVKVLTAGSFYKTPSYSVVALSETLKRACETGTDKNRKIIRQQFSQLTTRRLGTRGQSRYHYYGIAIRETSPYFQLSYSKKSVICGPDSRREPHRQVQLYSPRSRAGTILPEFPNIKDISLSSGEEILKITTFQMMYRTHCQRVLDTIVRACFSDIQNLLMHFWQGIPPHLTSVLGSNSLVNLVGVCDSILYRTISKVLLPSVLQSLSDSVTKIIQNFVHEYDYWLRSALFNLPENLRRMKLEVARDFIQVIRRQMSLNHLAQASRMVVQNSEIIGQMLHDWRQVDIAAICRETLYSIEQNEIGTTFDIILNLAKEFEYLIKDEAPIEAFTEWLNTLVNRCVLLPTARNKIPVRQLSRQFLLMWSAFGTHVIRDMTLHSAASFGSFHLLRLMFDDYIIFLIENIHMEDQIKVFLRGIATNSPPDFTNFGFGGTESFDFHGFQDPQRHLVDNQTHTGPESFLEGPSVPEAPGFTLMQRNSNDSSVTVTPPLQNADQMVNGYSWNVGNYYESNSSETESYGYRRSWTHTTVVARGDVRFHQQSPSDQFVLDDQVRRLQDPMNQQYTRNTCETNLQEPGCGYFGQYTSGRQPNDRVCYPSHHYPTIVYSTNNASCQNDITECTHDLSSEDLSGLREQYPLDVVCVNIQYDDIHLKNMNNSVKL